MKKVITKLFFLIVLFLAKSLFAQQIQIPLERIPKIEVLNNTDVLFTQYCEEVEASYRTLAKHQKTNPSFFSYTATKNDTLLTVAARCSLPYETIATLNSIENQSIPLQGKTLFLPTVSGIFVKENPTLPFEQLLYEKMDGRLLEQNNVVCYNLNNSNYYFFEGERFSTTERSFFLDSSIKMPLKRFILSSNFGMRISPISGEWKFHNGIDMAAPEGTEVFACLSATVLQCSRNDATFGNFIVLDHGGGKTSIYAHLSQILVKKGETVSTGQIIGKVGMTGLATGPHLHFEIRLNNQPSNPQSLIN